MLRNGQTYFRNLSVFTCLKGLKDEKILKIKLIESIFISLNKKVRNILCCLIYLCHGKQIFLIPFRDHHQILETVVRRCSVKRCS